MDERLGRRGKDIVSGWEGIITCRYEYMNGCVRLELSGSDKDGKPEAFQFDEQEVEVLRGGVDLIPRPEPSPPSGPEPLRTGGPQTRRAVSR